MQQRIHDDQRVAEDHAIDPWILMLVRAKDLITNGMPWIREEIEDRLLLVALVSGESLDDRLR